MKFLGRGRKKQKINNHSHKQKHEQKPNAQLNSFRPHNQKIHQPKPPYLNSAFCLTHFSPQDILTVLIRDQRINAVNAFIIIIIIINIDKQKK